MFGRKKENQEEKINVNNYLKLEKVLPMTLELADASKNVFKFTKDMGKSIRQLAEISVGISDLSQDTVANMEKFRIGIKYMTDAVEHIDSLVIENKEHSIKTVERIEDGGERLEVTVKQIEEVAHYYQHTIDTLESLNQYSKNISSITNYMDSIAAKTSLLAINASIEATRAGEAGQGFLVITHEIKVLAEQSKKFSKDIEEMLGSIKICVEQMGTTSQVNFDKIMDTKDAIRKLTQVLGEVLESSYVLNKNIEDTTKTSNQIKVAIHEGQSQVSELQEIIHKSNVQIEEMVGIIGTQEKDLRTLENVNDKVKKLSAQQIDIVMGEKVVTELKKIAEEMGQYTGSKDEDALKKLCEKYGAQNMYYGDSQGFFTHSNNKKAIGQNVFGFNPDFKNFYHSNEVIKVFELSRNLYTGEVTQFVGVKDGHSDKFISIGFGLEGLVKLYHKL